MVIFHLPDVLLYFGTFRSLQIAGVENDRSLKVDDDLVKQQRRLISSTFHQSKTYSLDSLGWNVVETVEVDGGRVQLFWFS
jgi:hypothetical protein